MSAKVLAVGLDAAEATVFDALSREGSLDGLSRLAAQGVTLPLGNRMRSLPGSIWPELCSGRGGWAEGRFCHKDQVHPGEALLRPLDERDVDPSKFYWQVASRAGRRVAVVDMPQTIPGEDLDGIQVCEWAGHDRDFRTVSQPPGLLDELRARHGDHPVDRCDPLGLTDEGRLELVERLVRGVEKKTELLLDLLGRERWDLFTCAFSESHCAGHQLWRFHDRHHPLHEPDAPAAVRDGLRAVYRALDRGVARLTEAAGESATVIAYSSHGMGQYVGGYHLLPEVLVRLGLSSTAASATPSVARRVQARVIRHVPRFSIPFLRWLAGRRWVQAAQAPFGALVFPLASPRSRAACVVNNRCGGIRLNLAGREPQGAVPPGDEAEALLDALSRELKRLVQPESGEPIVKAVHRPSDLFGGRLDPRIPDLLVEFREDLGLLDACRSERVGTVSAPVESARSCRSGDHTTRSRVWLRSPAMPAGALVAEGDVLDIPATVLSALDVALPEWMDGKPLESHPAGELAGATGEGPAWRRACAAT